MTEAPTKVLFRKDKSGEITAVFPEINEGRGLVACYAHLGQHSSCSRPWYFETKPAKPDEYAPLKRELEGAPYHYRLQVISRWPK